MGSLKNCSAPGDTSVSTGVILTAYSRASRIWSLLPASLLIPMGASAQKAWNDTGFGDWQTAASWTPAGVPVASDDVLLDNAQTVYVSSADAFARNLVVGADNDFGLEVGNLKTLTVGQDLTVAQNAASLGTLLATGGADLQVLGSVAIGAAGSGTLELEGGATATFFDPTVVGAAAGSGGDVSVEGSNTSLNVTGMTVGDFGSAIVSIGSAASLDSSGATRLGLNASGNGWVSLNGAGTSWTSSGNIDVGFLGEAFLSVRNSAELSFGSQLVIGTGAGSDGLLVVSSDALLSGSSPSSIVFVGAGGEGNLEVDTGGNVSVPFLSLGFATGSTGNALVTDLGTELETSQIYVGTEGFGEFSVRSGAYASTAAFASLGFEASGQGFASAQGSGSRWDVLGGTLSVGTAGEGSLSAIDGGSVAVWDDLVIGDLAGSVGSALARDGSVIFGATNDSELVIGNFGQGAYELIDSDPFQVVFSSVVLAKEASGVGALSISGQSFFASSILSVGEAGTGVLTLSGGGVLNTSFSATIGLLETGDGTVSVEGAGSRWTVASGGTLDVSGLGRGRVEIGGGAQVDVEGFAAIGSSSSSTAEGSLSVTGQFSRFRSARNMLLAPLGLGEITLSGGGQLLAEADLLGGVLAGSAATATVTGGVSVFQIEGDLLWGYGGEADLQVSNGAFAIAKGELGLGVFAGSDGRIEVDGAFFESQSLSVLGVSGTGWLELTNESEADIAGDLVLGNSPDGTGVFISRSSSSASIGGVVTVGAEGDGEFFVGPGASAVLAQDLMIGESTGSSGDVSIEGISAMASVSGTVTIGAGGSGSLGLFDGGTLYSGPVILGNTVGGLSFASLDGINTFWQAASMDVGLNGDSANLQLSGRAQLTVRGNTRLGVDGGSAGVNVGGTETVFFTDGILRVGDSGSAALNVTNGALASAVETIVGGMAGAQGTMLIDGAATSFTHGNNANIGMILGAGGSGAVTVQNGGSLIVENNNLLLLGQSNTGIGSLSVIGADSSATVGGIANIGASGNGNVIVANGGRFQSRGGAVGNNAGAFGNVSVSGLGSEWVTLAGQGITIGNAGNGSLGVSGGGHVDNGAGEFILGSSASSFGEVYVSGLGSVVESNNIVRIGSAGRGELTIDNGGRFDAPNIYLGFLPGGSGDVSVTGQDAELAATTRLYIGRFGGGLVTIDDGAHLNASVSLASSGGAVGTLNVMGGSSWTFNAFGGQTDIGGTNSSGVFSVVTVDEGSTAQGGGISLGISQGSTGELNLIGNGTTLSLGNSLRVGQSGEGVVNISSGAVVTTQRGEIGWNAGSIGVVNAFSGTLWRTIGEHPTNHLMAVGRVGEGTLNISAFASVEVASSAVVGGSTQALNGGSGTVFVSGSNSLWQVDQGVTLAAGDLSSGEIYLSNGGRLVTSGLVKGADGGSALFQIDEGFLVITGSQPNLFGNFGGAEVRLEDGGGTFSVFGEDEVIVRAPMSGPGKLSKFEFGKLVFATDQFYLGGTEVYGTLQVGLGGPQGSLGVGPVDLFGTLIFDRSDAFTVANAIAQTGNVVHRGPSVLTLTSENTYTGDTLIESGTLRLSDAAKLRFQPKSNGQSNRIVGSGQLELLGSFEIDRSLASTFNGNTWQLVDTSSLGVTYFSQFAIDGFTKVGGQHTLVDGAFIWTFDESTGELSLESPFGGTAYELWADSYGLLGSEAERGVDPDQDGFTNLEEFLFGGDPTAPTPALVSLSKESGDLVLRWLERQSGASYTLTETSNLTNPWLLSTVIPVNDPDQSAVPVNYVRRVAEVVIGSAARFLRIEALEEEPVE